MGAINGYILALHTVDEVEETIKELKETLGVEKLTWPQIFISQNENTLLVGGWTELYKYTHGKVDRVKNI